MPSLPGSDAARTPVLPPPMRRILVVLPRQSEEHPRRIQGWVRLRRRMDLYRHGPRYQAGPLIRRRHAMPTPSCAIWLAGRADGCNSRGTGTRRMPYIGAVDGAFSEDIDYAMLKKLYGQPQSPSADIARPSALGRTSAISPATPTRASSRPATAGGTLSPCGCRCVASLASRTPSQRRSSTSNTPWHSTSCSTISA